MALTLSEHAPAGTDISQVVRLLLVHDLVEVHAGDLHFAASEAELARQERDEAQAAGKLFGLLPEGQCAAFHDLWAEFEAQQTPEARFARALDALQPMLLTWAGGGVGCAAREPELSAGRVRQLKEPRLEEFPALWQLAQSVLEGAVQAGTLPTEKAASPIQD